MTITFKKTQEEIDGLESGTFEDEERVTHQALTRFQQFLDDSPIVNGYCFEHTSERLSASKYIAEVKS